jgi:predicted metal-dependent phosphoesterase TrpH
LSDAIGAIIAGNIQYKQVNMLIKADLHVHTTYSMDCATSLDEIVTRCLKLGIDCLAIADHGTIEGAIKLKEIAPFTVIVAEEVLTPHGEIMGMFLSEGVPSRLSVAETLGRIKAQNGLVCIPHPYDNIRPSSFSNPRELEEIMPFVDIIEVFNARNLFPGSRGRAQRLANKFGKLSSAGSDAHTASEIGNAYVEMPQFSNKDEFLKSLAQGQICGHKSSPLVHLASTRNKFKKHTP